MEPILVRLPTEILLRICEHLGEVHGPSVLSFALASKHCHSIANTVLFRTLSFHISTIGRLLRDTQVCTEILRRNQAFQHVRRVVLVLFDEERFGCRTHVKEDEERHERGEGARNSSSLDDTLHHPWRLGPVPTADWDINHQRMFGISDDSHLAWRDWDKDTPADVHAAVKDAFETDAAWEQLAGLIRLLPGLTDLAYECPAQFPPCLLQALHERMPGHTVRLHLHTFELRVAGAVPTADFVTVDPHVLALLASPCLHSIWLQDGDGTTDSMPGLHAEAFLQIIKTDGLALNLRDIRLSQFPRYPEQPPPYIEGPYACTWLPPELASRTRKLQLIELRHLELRARRRTLSITAAQLQPWDHVADLSGLQTLKLSASVEEPALDWLLSRCFPALTTLGVRCTGRPRAGYFDKIKRFIRTLPHLESLYIRGWDWSVASFVDLGGGNPCMTLKTLWLDHGLGWLSNPDHSGFPPRSPLVSMSEISRLGALYPLVETLSIPMRRSWGDSDEVALYRALGASFPRLLRLALTLESPAVQFGPTGSEDRASTQLPANQARVPTEYHNDSILSDMANIAIDADLARQIFKAISSSSLETMMLRAKSNKTSSQPMPPWWNELTRAWIVDTINPEREMKVKEVGKYPEPWRRVDPLPDLIEQKFRKLWPEVKEGSKGWYDDWGSFPLAADSEANPSPI